MVGENNTTDVYNNNNNKRLRLVLVENIELVPKEYTSNYEKKQEYPAKENTSCL